MVSQSPVIMPPLGWGHRQQRSKLVTTRKESTRCSPTTPLSWSGGAGGSASPSDGYDESNWPSDLSSGARSKVCLGFSLSFFISGGSVRFLTT
ncbi:unnamed protein product [Ilex paraguariensis]|uniref:Uncharacterized protein n=1 Tax=Ilex paraguariensis TaxID=185542 RepID=A0ABC8RUV1_9AQUA